MLVLDTGTFESTASVKSLPPGRTVMLGVLAALLAVADWLPENRIVDPDRLGLMITAVLAGSTIVVAMNDRLDARGWMRVVFRTVLLTITFAILLFAGEVTTRWMFRDVTTSSDNGGYFSRRWARTDAVHTNEAGFRGRAFADAKPAGTYRIAVVGDSFTYGNGIRQQDRFSDLLQAQLPSNIEVLNFGQPGANTPEHEGLLKRLLPSIHPDFVLLQWYVNDTEGDDSSGRPTFLPLMPIRSWHRWLNDASALYTVANMRWAEAQVALGYSASYVEYLKRRLADPDSRDSVRDRQILNALIEDCKKAGVPIGIVLFPDTGAPITADYPFGYLHDRVLAVCDAQRLTCLDLRDEFSKVKERQSLWANRLDHHPSARANAIASEQILKTYSAKWVAPPSR